MSHRHILLFSTVQFHRPENISFEDAAKATQVSTAAVCVEAVLFSVTGTAD